MWEIEIQPYGSPALAECLLAGWEPFANALMPVQTTIAVPNGGGPLAGFSALVSLRRWVDVIDMTAGGISRAEKEW